MSEEISQGKMMQVLDWSYDKAINGVPGLDSAQELAEDYLKQSGSLKSKANALIRWQNTKCATSGFISGLGGIITLPVAIPANIASVMYVQIRMIAAIAYMNKYAALRHFCSSWPRPGMTGRLHIPARVACPLVTQ